MHPLCIILQKKSERLYYIKSTFVPIRSNFKHNVLFIQVQANGNLLFPPFRAEDYRQEVHAQVYACLARNSVGTIHSRDVNVRAGKHNLHKITYSKRRIF